MACPSELPPTAIFSPFPPDEIASAAGRAAQAAKDAETARDEMRAILERLDQIQILGHMAFLTIIGTPDGTRRKADPFLQAHELELLQAPALPQRHSDLASR
jgi:hypothetical protein